MNFGVVVFPGTWSDCDFHYVISEVLHQPVRYVWHRDTNLADFDSLEDLKAQGNLGRVLLMTFSEFGRRVSENASGGELLSSCSRASSVLSLPRHW